MNTKPAAWIGRQWTPRRRFQPSGSPACIERSSAWGLCVAQQNLSCYPCSRCLAQDQPLVGNLHDIGHPQERKVMWFFWEAQVTLIRHIHLQTDLAIFFLLVIFEGLHVRYRSCMRVIFRVYYMPRWKHLHDVDWASKRATIISREKIDMSLTATSCVAKD